MRPIIKTSSMGLALLFVLALAGNALGALTAKTQIVDPLHVAVNAANTGGPFNNGQLLIDITGASNETPVRANSTFFTGGGAASGFKWGGYYSATFTTGNYGLRILDNNVGASIGTVGILISYTWVAGQYWYTIFDSNGTNSPNQYVNMSGKQAAISIANNSSAAIANCTFKVRAMLRSNTTSQWYVSDTIDISPTYGTTTTVFYFPVYGMKWYAVDTTVNSSLNALATADEAAMTFGTSSVTPDFSKVDGGGFFIDAVTGTNSNIGSNTGSSFKIAAPTWAASNTAVRFVPKVVGAPCYPKNTASLVLTPGIAQNGTITVSSSIPAVDLTVTNATIVGPAAAEFAVSGLPAFPVTLSGTSTMVANVAWTPSAADNIESSASLRLTCNADYTPGTVVDIPIKGRDMVAGTIYDGLPNAGNMARAKPAYNFLTPVVETPPLSGKGYMGFVWGGYSTATTTALNRDIVGFTGPNITGQGLVGRLAFYGAPLSNYAAGGCWHGCYAYGLFDTMGATASADAGVTKQLYIDRSVNLHKFQFICDSIPIGCQTRWLIRDSLGHWFLSKDITNMGAMPTVTWTTVDVENFTQGWLRVNTEAETYMDSIAAAQTANTVQTVAMAEPWALAAGTPNGWSTSAFRVTGGGMYIEVGNTDTTQTPLCTQALYYISQPTSGDTLTVSSTLATEPIKVPNRRLAIKGLAMLETGVETALDQVDVTVSPGTAGIGRLVMINDLNANGMIDNGENELTSCTLDANGTTAHLTFTPDLVVVKGTQTNLILAGVFNDTTTSKSFSFSIPTTAWKQNADDGGADTIASTPSPLTAAITVGPLSAISTTDLYESQAFSETWNGVAAAVLQNTSLTGAVTGADNTWNYTYSAVGTNNAVYQFAPINSSMALGAEVKDMTVEPAYNNTTRFDSSTPFLYRFGVANTNVFKVAFDLTITSTAFATAKAHLSGRGVDGIINNACFTLRLASLNNVDAYNFVVYPFLDTGRYLFSINSLVDSVTGPNQFSPKGIKDYGPAPAYTGLYKFTLWFSLYSDTATKIKVDMKQVETGKTLSWTTVVDGKLDDFKYVRLAYGAYPDYYIDNIIMTTYTFQLNPVKHWSIFE